MRTPMRDRRNSEVVAGPCAGARGRRSACSVEPLMPESTGSDGGMAGQGGARRHHAAQGGTTRRRVGPPADGACANLPIPAIACAVGRTVIRLHDGRGGPRRLEDRLPRRSDGQRRRRWWRRRRGWRQRCGWWRGAPCASSGSCAAGEVCTTEDGACNAPPGCGGGLACPAVCYGNCRPAKDGPACGTVRCAAGMVCCNDSCGTCTPPNGGCTKQICVPPAGACARRRLPAGGGLLHRL